MLNFKEKLPFVQAFVFDVDGVFSRPETLLYPNGELMRTMNTKDGYAIQYALEKGYKMAIISRGVFKAVKIRFQELGIEDVYIGSMNKYKDFLEFISKYNLSAENILYMGDDIPDYETMTKVGIPVCPADAVEEIQGISDYISDIKGGEGCVRDVVEQVLRAQNKWHVFSK